MNRFIKVGIWLLIAAAAVILPLYELADYTEVWQHDGDVILPAILFLFAGMALLGGKLVAYALLTLVVALSAVIKLFTPNLAAAAVPCKRAVGPPRIDLLLTLCDLRI